MFVVLVAMFSIVCFAVLVRGSFSAPGGGGVRDMGKIPNAVEVFRTATLTGSALVTL